MIVVTGATGQLGSAVIDHLLRLTPASGVRASVRKPEEAGKLAARGVEIRKGDFDEPVGLAHSFEGAERLLLISGSGIDYQKRVAWHRNAIVAAEKAGVGQIFYTSLLPVEGSVSYVMKAHLETEKMLKSSGVAHTILKNGVYAEAWELYVGEMRGGEAWIPADGPASWVSRMDLAEGTARLLMSQGMNGETLNLTGPGAMDVEDVLKVISRIQGHPSRRRIVPLEDYVGHMMASGKSQEFARQWATTYFGLALGEFGRIDPFLRAVLGRPLRTFEEVVGSKGVVKSD